MLFLAPFLRGQTVYAQSNKTWWEFQSIDTMKYSRDVAREKMNDPAFDQVIDAQVKNIAATGATHVGIATPYDEEFIPFLKRWVAAARKYNLNVWFRGNWSGWEGWFDYPSITREEHIKKTQDFILKNHYLFESGDIFSACPECENGGPGDPRQTRDVKEYRKFLVDEYMTTSENFRNIGVSVKSNFSPMNKDVADLIMDPETTKALGGIVVIDHYVSTPLKLTKDVENLARKSEGKVVLGEFGAPIPNINGDLTEDEQAQWINEALDNLTQVPSLIGINYWVNVGGSTQLWDGRGNSRKAVSVLSSYFKPKVVEGKVVNEINSPISNADIFYNKNRISSKEDGTFLIKYTGNIPKLNVVADGYKDTVTYVFNENESLNITLSKTHENIFFKIQKLLYRLFNPKTS